MSSYQETGKKINEKLLEILKDENISEEGLEGIFNAFIRMGQVAKYRCRNNSAYDRFIAIVGKDIVEVKRGPIPDGRGGDFEVLMVTKVITDDDRARKDQKRLEREAEREAQML